MGLSFSHELFEELAAFDPKWQEHYETLREAARAANALPLYYEYLATEQGHLRNLRMLEIPDTIRANKLERRMRERMLRRANKGMTDDFEADR